MPRATGPIGYIEHRSPQQDENGKYIIHPQFVQKEVYDLEDMMHDSQGRCMANQSQFISVETTMETLVLQALAAGKAVRLGDMLTIRPKLGIRYHKDKEGVEYKKTYYEGEKIPANEVEVCGFDIQPTKEFRKEFFLNHYQGCSRQWWSEKWPAASKEKEAAYVIKTCNEQGFVTVKNFINHFGVTKYHARKVLDSYCEKPAAWLSKDKIGGMMIYKLSTDNIKDKDEGI